MTVLTIKRTIAAIGALLGGFFVLTALLGAGLAVLATSTGADPQTIFTRPGLAVEAERPTTWVPAAAHVAPLSERDRNELGGLWHDAMVLRSEGRPASDDTVRTRFSPTVIDQFPLAGEYANEQRPTLVHHELVPRFVSQDGHLVEVNARTTIRIETTKTRYEVDEYFTATMVLRSTGWTVVTIIRDGLSES